MCVPSGDKRGEGRMKITFLLFPLNFEIRIRSDLVKQIAAAFPSVVNEKEEVDRRALGNIVFNDTVGRGGRFMNIRLIR